MTNRSKLCVVVIFLIAGIAGCGRQKQSATASQKQQPDGPFGFWRGMTKQQIIEAVGAKSITIEDKNIGMITLAAAPRPHPSFENYVVYLDSDTGLVKVIAVGKSIDSNDSGDQVKSEFKDLRESFISRYGQPSTEVDKIKSSSIWNKSNEWMMSLLKRDRMLAAGWSDAKGPSGLNAVLLEAKAQNSAQAYITAEYEFDGFEKYLAKAKAHRDSSL